MYEKLMEGLSMTFVGVTVVFASLALLCVIIYLFRYLPQRKIKLLLTRYCPNKKITNPKNVSSDDSLVAVLTAAVLASMKKGQMLKLGLLLLNVSNRRHLSGTGSAEKNIYLTNSRNNIFTPCVTDCTISPLHKALILHRVLRAIHISCNGRFNIAKDIYLQIENFLVKDDLALCFQIF